MLTDTSAKGIVRTGIVGLLAGFTFFVIGATVLPAQAGEALDTVRAINAQLAKHQANIAKMKAELAANPRNPDTSKLRDVLATAGGQRSAAFNNLHPDLQKLVNKFEGSVEKNVGGSTVMALGMGSPRTQFIVEISRSTQLVDELMKLRESLIDDARKEAYEERMDRLEREREAAESSAPATPSSTGPSGITTSSRLPRPSDWGSSGWSSAGRDGSSGAGWSNPGRDGWRGSGWNNPGRDGFRNPGRGGIRTAGTGTGRTGRTPTGNSGGSDGNCHKNPVTGALHCLGNKASQDVKDRFAEKVKGWNKQQGTRTAALSGRNAGNQQTARASRNALASRSLGRQPQTAMASRSIARQQQSRMANRSFARQSQARMTNRSFARQPQTRAARFAGAGNGRGFGRRR